MPADQDLDELERLAKAATQGDVRVEQIARSAIDDQEPVRPALVIPKPGDDLQALSVIVYGFFRQADADYYAAAQPQNLLPLIRELRRLRKVKPINTELLACCEAFCKWFDGWCPTQKCCADSGLPIHERTLMAIDTALEDKSDG